MSDIDPRSLREELEIRVVALLTGELPEADADELEKILSVDEELSDFRDRMAGLIGDVHTARDEITPPPAQQEMKLSEERRREIFGDLPVQESLAEEDAKKWWHLGVLEIAAMLVFGGFLAAILIPSVGAVRQEASRGVDSQSEVFFDDAAMLPESGPVLESAPMVLGARDERLNFDFENENYAFQAKEIEESTRSIEATRPPPPTQLRALYAKAQTVPEVSDAPALGMLFKAGEVEEMGKKQLRFGSESDFAQQPQFASHDRESTELRKGVSVATANFAGSDMIEQIVPTDAGVRLNEVADRNGDLGADGESPQVAMYWGSAGGESDELLVAELQAPISVDSKSNASLSVTTGDQSREYSAGAVVAGRYAQRSSQEPVEVALGDVMSRSDLYDYDESKDFSNRQQQSERPTVKSAPVSSTAAVATSEWATNEQSQHSGFYDSADLYAKKPKAAPVSTYAAPSSPAPLEKLSVEQKGDATLDHYAAFGLNTLDDYGVDSFASSVEGVSRESEIEKTKSKRLTDVDDAWAGSVTHAWVAAEATEVAQSHYDVDAVRVSSAEESLFGKRAAVRLKNTQQTPKPEKDTVSHPMSTFSLNVSDVSFKLAQAALNSQRIPDAALIRTEEFVNSFSYGDPTPRGDEAVSLNWEIAQHPYAHNRQIVRFSLQTQAAGRAANQPLNLNLLVDNSGSMQRPDRRAILEKSLESLQTKLTDQDQLNVVVFARQPKLIANANTVATQQAAIVDALNYQPQGGTNLEAGLEVAYQTAQANYNPAASNRVILMTDGAANLGDVNAEILAQQVIDNRKQGIALDAYGIGWEDYNDALLEEITRNGDGRYAFLNSVDTAAADFAEKLAGTLRVAAADVKVQIIWNPERVKTYRQVGYDLHQLREQDFRDNTVDAAEIGEAESGTALYVLQIDEDPEIAGGLGKLQVRYRVPATGEYVEHAWPLEMPRQISPLNEAPASLQLAATSALFAERLANNPYASMYDLADVEILASKLPEAFPKQSRVVELKNMIHTANALFTRVE